MRLPAFRKVISPRVRMLYNVATHNPVASATSATEYILFSTVLFGVFEGVNFSLLSSTCSEELFPSMHLHHLQNCEIPAVHMRSA